MDNKLPWETTLKLTLFSREGVTQEDFNKAVEDFLADWLEHIPDTGTAAPESLISGWHGGFTESIPLNLEE